MSTVPDFFQDESEQALRSQIEWQEQHLGLGERFFAKLLREDQRRFSSWARDADTLPTDKEDVLRDWWGTVLHLLSFQNFDGEKVHALLERTASMPPPAGQSVFSPPWSATSLKEYLENQGPDGIPEVNRWVESFRFGDPYAPPPERKHMPVNPALAITVPAGVSLFRITAVSFHTPNAAHHKKVVNGMGARKSHAGARYNYGGVLTVYLADTLQTCLAEKMFYFQREIVRRLDALHQPINAGVPAFSGTFTLWDIRFKKAVADVCHLTQGSASAVGVFPSLMLNPSQDYEHLKERRAFIEASGYNGIRAPSSRSTAGGEIIVLFDDQSKNVDLNPYTVEFRLVTRSPVAPFGNHMTELLDFTAGEVRFVGGMPPGGAGYANWTAVTFNH